MDIMLYYLRNISGSALFLALGFIALGLVALGAAACQSEAVNVQNPLDTPDASGPAPSIAPAPTDAPPAPAEMVQTAAPIDGITINIAESFPPQYFVEVLVGLPSGCVEFFNYVESRTGKDIVITVTNQEPGPQQEVACTADYRTHRLNVPLGTDFQSGETYTVQVNQVTEEFVAQ